MKSVSRQALNQALLEYRKWFEVWRSPTDVLARWNEIRRELKDRFYEYPFALVRQTNATGLREIHALARYSQVAQLGDVKLLSEVTRPDAVLRQASGEVLFEITEALDPERRRNQEFSKWEIPPKEVGQAELNREDAKILPALERALSRKKAKEYPTGTALLVYLNIGWSEADVRSEILRLISDSTPFCRVAVLWGDEVFDSEGQHFISCEKRSRDRALSRVAWPDIWSEQLESGR